MQRPPKLRAAAGMSATQRKQRGATLIEGLVAILIFSVGIIGIVGLQAASIQSTTQSKYRAEASFLANQLIGEMWADQANLASFATAGYGRRAPWQARVVATLPNGTANVVIVGNQATVTVGWTGPDGVARRVQSVGLVTL